MGGFAGIVDYSANFLFDIPKVNRRLGVMGVALQKSRFGVDVIENTGAFIQNADHPIQSADYYLRQADKLYYLFYICRENPAHLIQRMVSTGTLCLAELDAPFSGAFFSVADKELLLFRSGGGQEVFYIPGTELIFGTNTVALGVVSDGKTPARLLEEGSAAIFTPEGLFIKPL